MSWILAVTAVHSEKVANCDVCKPLLRVFWHAFRENINNLVFQRQKAFMDCKANSVELNVLDTEFII